MKYMRKCPKCGGTDIAVLYPGAHASTTNPYTVISTGFMEAACAERYVCLTCGYTEEYFRREDLEKIRKIDERDG